MLSHRNLVVGGASVSQYLENDADDVHPGRAAAQLRRRLQPAHHRVHGRRPRGAGELPAPRDIVRLCAQHGVTGLTCVPPLWIQLADQPGRRRPRAACATSPTPAAACRKPTLDRLRAIFPRAKPYLMYGLTEAFRSTYLDPAEVDRRPDSIGKAIPNAEILVVRADGTPCEPGEEGELVHRGALVALGYWNDPERTAERFRPAPGPRRPAICTPELAVWSGDVVVRDEEGFLYFVGRTRRDDQDVRLPGQPDRDRGGRLRHRAGARRGGARRRRPGARPAHRARRQPGERRDARPDELLGRAARSSCRSTWCPSDVVVRPSCPRSPNGKFDRNLLRQELAAS